MTPKVPFCRSWFVRRVEARLPPTCRAAPNSQHRAEMQRVAIERHPRFGPLGGLGTFLRHLLKEIRDGRCRPAHLLVESTIDRERLTQANRTNGGATSTVASHDVRSNRRRWSIDDGVCAAHAGIPPPPRGHTRPPWQTSIGSVGRFCIGFSVAGGSAGTQTLRPTARISSSALLRSTTPSRMR